MKVKSVARRLYQKMLEYDKEWLLDRGKPVWVRVIIAKPISCFSCEGEIKERQIADLFCVEFAFRKICLEVFCEFCSRGMKRNNALVNALYQLHFNGRVEEK